MQRAILGSSTSSATVRRSPRRRAGLIAAAAAAILLGAVSAAIAVSAALAPGATIPVPSTTAAAEPSLAGVVQTDTLVPFVITDAAGQVVCSGNLQNRVVRSNTTGLLDFYYRIRDTRGPGRITQISSTGFGNVGLSVGNRTDGLGTIAATQATRSAAPGDAITIAMRPAVRCSQNEESQFILLKANWQSFQPGGTTRIFAGNAVVTVPTVRP